MGSPRVDDATPQRVQRQDAHLTGPVAKLAGHFVAQAARGFGGEADHQDRRRILTALVNKEGNTPGERRRLAAPGSSDDGQRPISGGNRLQLSG